VSFGRGKSISRRSPRSQLGKLRKRGIKERKISGLAIRPATRSLLLWVKGNTKKVRPSGKSQGSWGSFEGAQKGRSGGRPGGLLALLPTGAVAEKVCWPEKKSTISPAANERGTSGGRGPPEHLSEAHLLRIRSGESKNAALDGGNTVKCVRQSRRAIRDSRKKKNQKYQSPGASRSQRELGKLDSVGAR